MGDKVPSFEVSAEEHALRPINANAESQYSIRKKNIIVRDSTVVGNLLCK